MTKEENIFMTAATTGKPISDEQIIEVMEAIKKASEYRGSVGEIRFMLNKYLPDDLVIVSENIYRIITHD